MPGVLRADYGASRAGLFAALPCMSRMPPPGGPVAREFPRRPLALALPQADGSSHARLGTPPAARRGILAALASERAAWPGVLLGELRTVSRAHLPVPVYAVDTTGD